MTVDLSKDLTALVGANGSGKTAILMALTRLFGPTQSLRTIQRSDFHLPPGVAPHDRSHAELTIEITVTFPELDGTHGTSYAVPSYFDHMIIESPGGEPFCRLRLDATWTDDGTSDGHVDQQLNWVLTDAEDDLEGKTHRIAPEERGLIQVHYIPANRDPAPELRGAARSRLGRLLRAVTWGESTLSAVHDAGEEIQAAIASENPVQTINDLLQKRWDDLRYRGESPGARLRFAGSTIDDIIRAFGVEFYADEHGYEVEMSGLSEGQLSLFYLALVSAIFDIEREVAIDQGKSPTNNSDSDDTSADEHCTEGSEDSATGFNLDQLSLPALTIFEIEEPENHLAPHYLARIIAMLRSLTKTGQVQALFSSHSASVLGRVSPEEVRYLRLDKPTRTSLVKNIVLPESSDQASKYVREAVVAYPELYFGKFVILAEGPSEEVVLPRIASAINLDIDKSFVCVVPLGGRHVNHFWKLLDDLEIPHATLLDLDAGRETGGWARIKYICNQLLQIEIEPSELLKAEYKGQTFEISMDELDNLHNKEIEKFEDFYPWVNHLENFGVYFSGPLDFDLSLLRCMPEAYKSIDGLGGPVLPPEGSPEREQYFRSAIGATVRDKKSIIDLYMSDGELKELCPWYRDLFKNRSKPSTHLQALSELQECVLDERAPKPLKRLLERCQKTITP